MFGRLLQLLLNRGFNNRFVVVVVLICYLLKLFLLLINPCLDGHIDLVISERVLLDDVIDLLDAFVVRSLHVVYLLIHLGETLTLHAVCII